MFFGGEKIAKCFLAAGFVCCAAVNFADAQAARLISKNQNSVAAMLAQANGDLQSGDLGQAKVVLQKILLADTRNVAAHTLFGAVADRENDLKTAELHFAQAAELSPKSPETRNNYGVILLRLNRRDEAAKEFAASLALNPQQSSALVNLAQIRFDEKNYPAARELFEKARVIAPDREILRALLLISLQTGEKERAAREFKDYFESIKNDSSAADSESFDALGKLLSDNNLTDEAERIFETAPAKNANNANTLILRSKNYLRRKDVKSAGRLLESAVAKGIDDAKIYAALADVYQAGGFYENAVPAMRLAIEKEPNNDFYTARYGLLLIDAKAPAAAIIRLTEAAAKLPNSGRIRLVLGIAQQIDGRQSDARNSFERALQIEPRSIPAMAYLATSYVEQAQYAEAVKIYRQAVFIEETNAVLHYLLADALLKIPTADEAEAQKHLIRAAMIDGTFAPAHAALGKIYARQNNWQAAAAEFEQAVKNAPDSAEAFYQFGRALARLKRTDESKTAFAQYKKLNESQSAEKENDRRELVRRLANVQF